MSKGVREKKKRRDDTFVSEDVDPVHTRPADRLLYYCWSYRRYPRGPGFKPQLQIYKKNDLWGNTRWPEKCGFVGGFVSRVFWPAGPSPKKWRTGFKPQRFVLTHFLLHNVAVSVTFKLSVSYRLLRNVRVRACVRACVRVCV